MSINFIIIPLAFLMIANLFQPTPQAGSPAYLYPISSSSNPLGNEAILICTVNGCTTYFNNPFALCEGTSDVSKITQSIPILSNIYNFFAGIGAQLTGKSDVAKACFFGAQTVFTFAYNPTNPDTINFALISVLFIVIGTVTLISVTVGASVLGTSAGGLNSGSVLTLIIGITALMLWVILSGNALTTFQAIPYNIGAYIYFIITLGYTIGIIQLIGVRGG